MSGYVAIGMGGAIGAILRVSMMRLFPHAIGGIPVRILMINIIGCFLIGILTEILTLYWNAPLFMRHFLVQGLLGGFTTFSAFALESGILFDEGKFWLWILYILASVIFCLLFFFIGLRIVRFMHY